jgi:murein DD-endopeptidase MepM/ murein hydrolase activator NlpD
MNLSPIDQVKSLQTTQKASPEALRKAAMQFEAVLLTQLTSAMNGPANEDEDSLFGGDGGAGLAKQMFSEQIATSMAQSGGVGLSDIILRQFGGQQPSPTGGTIRGLADAMKAIKGPGPRTSAIDAFQKQIDAVGSIPASAAVPAGLTGGDPADVQIISTFEDQLRAEGIDSSLSNLVLDGKVVNTTRARIVPNAPVTQVLTGNDSSPSNPMAMPFEKVGYHLPVAGRISSGFGNRFHPIDHKVKFHAGMDIAVPVGTTVGAAAKGVVKFAGRDGGYGNLVVIRHPDGKETKYGHLSKILVAAGEPVSSGQPIALSGSTGKSTGPHVHFEVRENGKAINPTKFLSNVLSKTVEK